jgi:hypothetical protein
MDTAFVLPKCADSRNLSLNKTVIRRMSGYVVTNSLWVRTNHR